jgi:hypothetical protein
MRGRVRPGLRVCPKGLPAVGAEAHLAIGGEPRSQLTSASRADIVFDIYSTGISVRDPDVKSGWMIPQSRLCCLILPEWGTENRFLHEPFSRDRK